MDGWMDGHLGRLMVSYLDRWMDGWKVNWKDGLIDG